MNNILIIGAHYDDAELGVGGTAAKLVNEGKKVYKLTLTNNKTAFKQMNIYVDTDDSKEASRKACDTLGVEQIDDFDPVECNHLEYSTKLMQKIEKIIYDYKIDTLFIHSDSDINQDHVSAAKLCLTAGRHCDNILQYQSNGYIFSDVYYPTYFVDISRFIDKKRKALSFYPLEHNRFNRLFETSIERNHTCGYANNVEYAEGFRVIKFLER